MTPEELVRCVTGESALALGIILDRSGVLARKLTGGGIRIVREVGPVGVRYTFLALSEEK